MKAVVQYLPALLGALALSLGMLSLDLDAFTRFCFTVAYVYMMICERPKG